MNAIDGKEKLRPEDVYGSSDTILCAHPDCKEAFRFSQKYPSKKYHSKECKNGHHKMERVAGQKVLARGTIHAALLEKSPRLQRVVRFLSDGKSHSTREILYECNVCNVPANELRHSKNGFTIDCEQRGKYWYYTMVAGFEQLLRIV